MLASLTDCVFENWTRSCAQNKNSDSNFFAKICLRGLKIVPNLAVGTYSHILAFSARIND
jgi:hypothetical protein